MSGQNLTAILGVSVVTLVLATISNAMLPEPPAQVVARAMGQLPVQVAAIQRVEPQDLSPAPRFAPAPNFAPAPDFAPAPGAPAPSAPAPEERVVASAQREPVANVSLALATQQPSDIKPKTDAKPKEIVRHAAAPARERKVREASARQATDPLSFYPYER